MSGHIGNAVRAAAFALAALFASATVHAQQVVALQVGGKDLRFEVPAGYVQGSVVQPKLFEITSASAPPTNRLVESFMAESDAKRLVAGAPAEQPAYQVQALRDAEALDFSDADWKALRPVVAKSFGEIDINKVADAIADGSSQRMSAAAGAPIDMRFDEVGKPEVYHDESDSIRFVMLVPMKIEVAGSERQMQMELAGAVLPLSGKMVFLYSVCPHAQGGDSSKVRAALDHFVERALALNRPGAAAPATAPATSP